jgi:flagellar basal body rod protein FlgG
MALNGNGFFTIATPQGERYTRDGHFSLDQDGRIVTSDGYAVQGEGGAITITPTDGDIHVAADGTISSVVNGTLNQLGKLRLTDFADARSLTREGGNLYAASQPGLPATATLVQGALESSNVQPVLEISKMIEVMRAYEATATLSKSQSDLDRDAITKLGAMPN